MNKVSLIVIVLIVLAALAWYLGFFNRPASNFTGEAKPYVPDNLYQPEIK